MIRKPGNTHNKVGNTLVFAVTFLVMVISVISCDSNRNTIVIDDPDYANFAADRVSDLRLNKGEKVAFVYIDSLKKEVSNNSLQDQYYIFFLYYDTYNRLGKIERASAYVDSMRKLLDDVGGEESLYKKYISVNYFKADILFQQKRFDESYQYYYNALSLSREYNDSCDQYYYYMILGHVLYKNEQYYDALRYYRTSNTLLANCSTEFWTYFRYQQATNNVALCYEKLKMYDSAIATYKKTIDLIETGYQRFPEDKHELMNMAKAVAQGNLASAYTAVGKYELAEPLFISSIDTNDIKGRDRPDAQYNRVKLANMLMQIDRYADAKAVLDQVDSLSTVVQNAKVEKRWNKAMWMYWDEMDDPSMAYVHLKRFKQLDDSLRETQSDLSFADIDARVSNIANNYQIDSLKKRAVMRKTYMYLALVLFVLALAVVVLVVQNLRRSRRHVKMLKIMNSRINDQKSQLKETYSELESADSEKDRILKAVSHDMRSPVNSAIALTDLLLATSDNLNEEQVEYLTLIKNSCDNALTLTKDLLEVATLSSVPLDKEAVNINEFIKSNVELLKYRAAEKQQEILLQLPENVISANINKEKMTRVVNNLITNAVKFSPANSSIAVMLSVEKNMLHMTVKDQGIGIPKDMQEKVFDLFTEAKRFGTSGEQPFGLGLSISKQIVESHDGEIWFETEEGKGTTFYVALPLT